MFLIGCLMNPVTDLVTISKYIKQFYEEMKSSATNQYYIAFFSTYILIIAVFGIYSPLQTLYFARIPKQMRQVLTTTENVKRVIAITNATRNYLLASFSLFFVLVTWRLFDLIIFSARLYEFSDLMGQYNLVDVDLAKDEPEDTAITEIIDELVDEGEDDPANWPVVVELNSEETLLLKKFLEEASLSIPTNRLESLLFVPNHGVEDNDNIDDPLHRKTKKRDSHETK